MSLDSQQVESIANLARLEIQQQDIAGYTQNLSKILSLVQQMDQLDTLNIQPMAHPLDAEQRLRKDAVTETDQHELFQGIAPSVEANLYLVPQVIET